VTATRLSLLRKEIGKGKLSALLVTSLPNVRYLTGFTGSSGAVIVDRREAVFLTDFRYRIQAAGEVRACRRVEQTGSLVDAVAGIVRQKRWRRLGFEEDHLSWAAHRSLAEALPGIELVPTAGRTEKLRMIKDRGEVALLRGAVRLAAAAYGRAARILAGRREDDVAAALEISMLGSGAEGPAFPPIVAGGRQGALPHAVPGKRRLRRGDLVILDFGARYRGYHSDISRTRIPGRATARARELYRIVAEAQREAIAAVKPGVPARAVDEAARSVIEAAGYGKHFGHGTGHGVGLEVHEGPSITSRSGVVLEKGMVFTVEPGIYIENFGGVRIEDMVLVTASGCAVLTRPVPKVAP